MSYEEIAKKRGFIFRSSEIYGGLAGAFDFGPLGIHLKRKIEESWRNKFCKSVPFEAYEIYTAPIMPRKVWEASGHLKDFVDPLTCCESCKKHWRADKLVEEATKKPAEGLSTEELTKKIENEPIKCPTCNGNLSEVRIFNLMIRSAYGPVEREARGYLRPETAQGIFVNFPYIARGIKAKPPFGIAQIGPAFRNEISPRGFLRRLRQFNQLELELFLKPDQVNKCKPIKGLTEKKLRILTRREQKKGSMKIKKISVKELGKEAPEWLIYFLLLEQEWYQSLGIPRRAIRFKHKLPDETPHYSEVNFDLEIKLNGWEEIVGNAYRTDFDLSTHQKHSGKDFSIQYEDEKILLHVVEPSFGLERTFLAILKHCWRKGKKRGWEWFQFPMKFVPKEAGILPLVKKNGLPEKARKIYEELKLKLNLFYDESGSIGKRYARADEIGTAYCITIDHQTLEDESVTIRERDSARQIRVPSNRLLEILKKLLKEKLEFTQAGKPYKGF